MLAGWTVERPTKRFAPSLASPGAKDPGLTPITPLKGAATPGPWSELSATAQMLQPVFSPGRKEDAVTVLTSALAATKKPGAGSAPGFSPVIA